MDVFSKRQRSRIMRSVKNRGNASTENRLTAIFRQCRITGWRRGSALPGKPDFVFSKLRLVVFVDGCFWHGCPQHRSTPATNASYWREKLAANRRRDRRVDRELASRGWRVLRIWEHELGRKREARLIMRLKRAGLHCTPADSTI